MADIMVFPETWEEYEEVYGFTDTEQIYTNVRPKGKWEKHKTKSGKNWWKCSQCGHVEMKRYPYCAICGSDMRGEE